MRPPVRRQPIRRQAIPGQGYPALPGRSISLRSTGKGVKAVSIDNKPIMYMMIFAFLIVAVAKFRAGKSIDLIKAIFAFIFITIVLALISKANDKLAKMFAALIMVGIALDLGPAALGGLFTGIDTSSLKTVSFGNAVTQDTNNADKQNLLDALKQKPGDPIGNTAKYLAPFSANPKLSPDNANRIGGDGESFWDKVKAGAKKFGKGAQETGKVIDKIGSFPDTIIPGGETPIVP